MQGLFALTLPVSKQKPEARLPVVWPINGCGCVGGTPYKIPYQDLDL